MKLALGVTLKEIFKVDFSSVSVDLLRYLAEFSFFQAQKEVLMSTAYTKEY